MDTEQNHRLASLQKQIDSLTSLYSRLQSVRQIPHTLLQTPIIGSLPSVPLNATPLRQEFLAINGIREDIKSDDVQEALRAARESEKEDATNLHYNIRRENQKRRRLPSPDSPKPYISVERKERSLFPPADEEVAPLRVHELTGFITQFNKASSKSKIHIWMRNQPAASQLPDPVILRFTTRDVLAFFVALNHTSAQDSVLTVESCTAFGPRERKSPHSFSDYNAFQNLSQHLAEMIQSHHRVSFQSITSLLTSYEGIFVDRCVVCERVLSAEGHVPPVARLWVEAEKEEERGRWEPRHVTCLQS